MSHSRSKVVVCVHVPIHCSCVLNVKCTFRAEQRKLHRMGFKPVHSGTPVWHPTSGAAQLVASFPGLSGGRRETPGDPGLMHEIKFSVYGECARKDFADTHVYDASMSSVCFATTNNSTLWPRVPTLTAPRDGEGGVWINLATIDVCVCVHVHVHVCAIHTCTIYMYAYDDGLAVHILLPHDLLIAVSW